MKQMWRKWLIKAQFPSQQVKQAMEKGILDLSSILSPDEVEMNGVSYVHSLIEDGLSRAVKRKCESFWVYVEKQSLPLLMCGIFMTRMEITKSL